MGPQELIDAGASLLDSTEPESNPEYLRGMAELLARTFPCPDAPTYETARKFRQKLIIAAIKQEAEK